MNNTRNYTEADTFLAELNNKTLPLRTNISLSSWDMPNMGGNLVALWGNATIFTLILILIETGFFIYLVKICNKKEISKFSKSQDLEGNDERFEPDVIREA